MKYKSILDGNITPVIIVVEVHEREMSFLLHWRFKFRFYKK